MAAIASPKSEEQIELGIGYQLLELKCANHNPIIEFAMHEWQEFEENRDSLVRVQAGSGSSMYLELQRGWSSFELATSRGVPLPGPERFLGEWIDNNLLRQWKHSCTCELVSLVPELSHIRPRLLIDTLDLCLKWACLEDQYLALSYVWGQSSTFKTTSPMFDSLHRPGAFDDIKLPATIKHAMLLTRKLEERFLWVDALCIIQDDVTFRDQEINNMAAIFSNAKITVTAAGGPDSAYGLRGINGGFPRKPLQTCKLPDSSLVVRHHPTSLSLTIWGSRGWNFQEELFSTRKIIFKDDTVEWQCCCAR